jgi:hypothetical protein
LERRHAIGCFPVIVDDQVSSRRLTNYLTNAGLLEMAHRMACRELAKTTKFYDRREDALPLDDAEWIVI